MIEMRWLNITPEYYQLDEGQSFKDRGVVERLVLSTGGNYRKWSVLQYRTAERVVVIGNPNDPVYEWSDWIDVPIEEDKG